MTDPAIPTAPSTDQVATVEAHPELIKAQRQAAEHLAGWQRAKADYLNLKKQSEKDLQEMAKVATAAFIIQLIPIYDSFKRGLAHVPADEQGTDWVKGFQHTFRQLQQLFEKMRIKEIPTVGQPFDHLQHHAVGREKRDGVTAGTILEEVKTGFTMDSSVIEPAQVRVAE